MLVSLTINWINFSAYKIQQPDLCSVCPGMQVQQHCPEHHWLPVKARIQCKTACLFFQCIYQNSMPWCLSNLLHPCYPSRTLLSLDTPVLTVPRLKPLEKDLSLFLDPLSGTLNHYPPEKTLCFTTFKQNIKTHLFEIHLY